MRTAYFLALCLAVPACYIDDDGDDGGGTHYCGDYVVDYPLETCDDGNTVGGDGCSATCQPDESFSSYISASWNLRTVAGATIACPSTFDTAAVYNQPVTANGTPTGQPIIDLFDCANRSGTTAPLPAGQYLSWVEITNFSATQTYAQSLSTLVDTRTMDQSLSVSIYSDGGFFQFRWALVGANSNAPLTCAQAGATGGVQSIGTDVASSTNMSTDQFDCASASAVTDAFLQGTYSVAVTAHGMDGQIIGTASPLTNKLIQAPNRVTDLGSVQIPITGH